MNDKTKALTSKEHACTDFEIACDAVTAVVCELNGDMKVGAAKALAAIGKVMRRSRASDETEPPPSKTGPELLQAARDALEAAGPFITHNLMVAMMEAFPERYVADKMPASETSQPASKTSNIPPVTDLMTGTVHVCTLGDGTRILVRGDLLILWREGEQASMTGKQWLATTDEIERRRIEVERYDTAIASRDLELDKLQRRVRRNQNISAFEQSSPQAYVDGLAPETSESQLADEFAAEAGRLREALERVERWYGEFPSSGRFWEDGSEMSYAAAFGSNGERDYMRQIAREAIAVLPPKRRAAQETPERPVFNHERDCGLTNDSETCECPQFPPHPPCPVSLGEQCRQYWGRIERRCQLTQGHGGECYFCVPSHAIRTDITLDGPTQNG